MELDQDHPYYSLRLLVHSFEDNPRELTTVHDSFVQYYGYPILARALNFIYPKIPDFDRKPIENYIDSHNFPSFSSLAKGIEQFKTDIEKLFAIFYWTAHNIEYDVDSYLNPGRRQSQKSQDVFANKKAVCEGYSSIVLNLAQEAGIQKIKLACFSNYAKGASYNSFKPPKDQPSSNHATVYVEINGVPYICEPTWGAGHLSDQHFKFSYNYHQFLIPLQYALVHYFPLDESKSLVPFTYTYTDFLRSPVYHLPQFQMASESHPFRRFTINEGFLEMQFSCNSFETILGDLSHLDNNKFVEQSRDYINFKILQTNLKSRYFTLHNTPVKRTRFKAQIGFPKEGVWKFEIYLNTHQAYECYIDVKQKASIIPFLHYENTDALFIPIVPTTLITHVKNVALIRFAVSFKRCKILINMEKCKEGTLDTLQKIDCKNYYEYMCIQIPFDDTRCEDWLTVVFPSKGRFKVCLYLANDTGSYTSYMNYYFDVDEGKSESVNPIEYLTDDRNSIKLMLKEPITSIDPPDSFIFRAEQGECITVTSKTEDLNLNLKYNDKTLFPKKLGTDNVNGQYQVKYQLNFEGPGVYHLLYFADNKYVCTQDYLFGKSMNYADSEETKLMQKLKIDIDRYGTNLDELEDIPEHIKQSAMVHIGGGTQPPKMLQYTESQEEKEKKEREERERIERERKAQEEKDRLEKERKDKEEKERLEQERKAKEEKELLEQERKAKEEQMKKLNEEKKRKAKEEKERKEKEERERLEREKQAKEEQMKKMQEEKERKEKERKEKARLLLEEKERQRKEMEEKKRLENEEKERKRQEELEKQRKERRELQKKLKEKRQQEIKELEMKEQANREQREKEDKERERLNKLHQEKIQKENEKRKKDQKQLEDKQREEREKEQKRAEKLHNMKNKREQQLQEKISKQQIDQAEQEKEERHRQQKLLQDKERLERLRQKKYQQQLQKQKEEEEKKLLQKQKEEEEKKQLQLSEAAAKLEEQDQTKLIRQKLLRQKEKEIRERDQKLREEKFKQKKLKEQEELEKKEREQEALNSYKKQIQNFYIQRNHQRVQFNKQFSHEQPPTKPAAFKSYNKNPRNKSVPKKLFTTSTQTDDLPLFPTYYPSPRVIEHVSEFFIGDADMQYKSPRRIKAIPTSNQNLNTEMNNNKENKSEVDFNPTQNVNTPRIINENNHNIVKPIQQPNRKAPRAPRMIKSKIPNFKEPE